MKRDIRNAILHSLSAISRDLYEKRSRLLIDRLIETYSFSKQDRIGITLSRFPEVNTAPFIEWCWTNGIPVAAPVANPKTKEMNFYFISSWEDVKEGYKCILEPQIHGLSKLVTKEELTHLLVPGVAYNTQGYRIGFGGGFYDRFLEHYKGKTVSLVFKEQLSELIEIEPHDLPVQTLILEDGIIRTGAKEK